MKAPFHKLKQICAPPVCAPSTAHPCSMLRCQNISGGLPCRQPWPAVGFAGVTGMATCYCTTGYQALLYQILYKQILLIILLGAVCAAMHRSTTCCQLSAKLNSIAMIQRTLEVKVGMVRFWSRKEERNMWLLVLSFTMKKITTSNTDNMRGLSSGR